MKFCYSITKILPINIHLLFINLQYGTEIINLFLYLHGMAMVIHKKRKYTLYFLCNVNVKTLFHRILLLSL